MEVTTTELLDARGVEISPGDTAIYGFSVSRSVAMAEAVVLGEPTPNLNPAGATCVCAKSIAVWCSECEGNRAALESPSMGDRVSLTASGRVRLRVVRRSYSSGEKPIVDVAPDRLVVLKPLSHPVEGQEVYQLSMALPPSPLPTQGERARVAIEREVARSVEALRATEAPEWWIRQPGIGGHTVEAIALAEYHTFHARKLREDRRKLKELE